MHPAIAEKWGLTPFCKEKGLPTPLNSHRAVIGLYVTAL